VGRLADRRVLVRQWWQGDHCLRGPNLPEFGRPAVERISILSRSGDTGESLLIETFSGKASAMGICGPGRGAGTSKQGGGC
jgi:hypothetical protein